MRDSTTEARLLYKMCVYISLKVIKSLSFEKTKIGDEVMKKYYIAVTYDVCEYEDLFIDMNEYRIDDVKDMDQQVREIAKVDVSPLVKVYESDTSDFEDFRLYREYVFKEFECSCNGS